MVTIILYNGTEELEKISAEVMANFFASKLESSAVSYTREDSKTLYDVDDFINYQMEIHPKSKMNKWLSQERDVDIQYTNSKEMLYDFVHQFYNMDVLYSIKTDDAGEIIALAFGPGYDNES